MPRSRGDKAIARTTEGEGKMKKVFSILVALALLLGLGVVATPVLAEVTPAVVDVEPPGQDEEARYTVTFNISAGLEEDRDSITVEFPPGTGLPEECEWEDGDITVDGIDVPKTRIDIDGRKVSFWLPVDVAKPGPVVVVFTEDFGITNPPASDEDYYLWVNTSVGPDITPIKSEGYRIGLAARSTYKFFYGDPDDIWVEEPVEFNLTVKASVEGNEGYDSVYILFGADPEDVLFEGWDEDEGEGEWVPLEAAAFNGFTHRWGPFELELDHDEEFEFRFTFDEVGLYTISLALQDDDSGDLIVEDEVTAVVTGVSFKMGLSQGWNLISLPIVPDDDAIAMVLKDILEDVISVWYYHPQEDWQVYRPGGPSDLWKMKDGQAYWINMNKKADLTVVGHQDVAPPGEAPPPPPPAYNVVKGWNMVGFRSMVEMNADDYLKNTDYVRILGFDRDRGWFNVGPGKVEKLEPGLGYWVAFSEPGTIYP